MNTSKTRFKPKSDRGAQAGSSRGSFSPRGKDSYSSRNKKPSRFGQAEGDFAPKRSYKSKEGDFTPRRSFRSDDSDAPKRSFKRSEGDFAPRRSFRSDDADAPKRSFKRSEGGFAPRRSFRSDDSDAPKRSYKRNDGDFAPRRSFRSDDSDAPKRSYKRNDGDFAPRRSFRSDDSDAPRRSYKRNDGDFAPRRSFRPDENASGGGFVKKSSSQKFSRPGDKIRASRNFKTFSENTSFFDSDTEEGKNLGGETQFSSSSGSNEESFKSPNVQGLHAITALLESNPEQVQHLFLQKDSGNKRLYELQKLADSKKVRIHQVPPRKLDLLCGHSKHQGALAICHDREMLSWDDFLVQLDSWEAESDTVSLVLPAAIEDPRNLGAILRSAVGLGFKGCLLPKTGATGITPLVHKASAGASQKIAVCTLPNAETALPLLKERGYKLIGLSSAQEAHSPEEFAGIEKLVMVVGGEDKDIPAYISKQCEGFCCLPMEPELHSYNASVAFSLFAYHLKHLNN